MIISPIEILMGMIAVAYISTPWMAFSIVALVYIIHKARNNNNLTK